VEKQNFRCLKVNPRHNRNVRWSRLKPNGLVALGLISLIIGIIVPTEARATNAMVVDGTPSTIQSSGVGNSSLSTNLATTRTNDILIAYVGWESGGASSANSNSASVVSATGTPALTWTLRTRYQNGGDQTQEIWWAVAPTAGTYGVKVSWSGQVIDDVSMILFAINGANTLTPWEGTSATKVSMGSLNGSYSTSYPNDYVLTFYANEKATTVSSPLPGSVNSPISNINNPLATWWEYIYVAGAPVTSPISNQIWGWNASSGAGNTYAAVIIDALRDTNYVDINTVSINVNTNLAFRSVTTLQATIPSASGKVTFYLRGKPIPSCKNMKVSGTNLASCNWKPSGHGTQDIYAIYVSDGGQQFKSPTQYVNITARQSPR